MNPGLRTHKRASLRIAHATSLPDDMQSRVREILAVASDDKQHGHATALLHQVTHEADKNWMTLLIHVLPFDDGMTIEQLKKWYGRFGFEEIQAEPCLMLRSPCRPTRIVRLNS